MNLAHPTRNVDERRGLSRDRNPFGTDVRAISLVSLTALLLQIPRNLLGYQAVLLHRMVALRDLNGRSTSLRKNQHYKLQVVPPRELGGKRLPIHRTRAISHRTAEWPVIRKAEGLSSA